MEGTTASRAPQALLSRDRVRYFEIRVERDPLVRQRSPKWTAVSTGARRTASEYLTVEQDR